MNHISILVLVPALIIVFFVWLRDKRLLPRFTEGTFKVESKEYKDVAHYNTFGREYTLYGNYKPNCNNKMYKCQCNVTERHYNVIAVGDNIKVECVNIGSKMDLQFISVVDDKECV